MRIGSGFDAHKFADVSEQGVPSDAGISIKLGGVSVPSEKAILAHSDGDVILHALCDAILGALALGDIGRHFRMTTRLSKTLIAVHCCAHVSK